MAERYPDTNEGVGAVLKPYTEEFVGQKLKLVLGLMASAVALVLLVACLNVANLLLGRAFECRHELALRRALGAGRLRTMGQVLAEAMLITTGGVLLGVALADFGVAAGLVVGLVLGSGLALALRSFLFQVETVDPVTFVAIPVFLSTVAILACLVPARRASSVDPLTALRGD